MRKHTTPSQRQEFYELFQQGLSYREIASRHGVSRECVQYWCRRQRDGGSCQTAYHREPGGILGRFDGLVRYCVLRLRIEHPKWGPGTLLYHLGKRPSLKGIKLPSGTEIGRYLHQWERFRRRSNGASKDTRPNQPTEVHQRWQVDFKTSICLQDGTVVDLHTVRDPVGEACIGAVLHVTQRVNTRTKRVTMRDVQTTLRRCFDRWNTLPDEIQTDGEPTLGNCDENAFPSDFTLWLVGLDIAHLVTRRHTPTDNAEVERCHRTVNDYAIIGNEKHSVVELQSILDETVVEMAIDLPSRADGCAGRTPTEAHPELMESRRPFQAAHELALFDLSRVDTFLSTFAWTRKVNKVGQVSIGGQHQYYSVGQDYAHQQVVVRFDPTDRSFVFYLPSSPRDDLDLEHLPEIARRPARDIETEHLTGLTTWPDGLVPQQLPLPLCFLEG